MADRVWLKRFDEDTDTVSLRCKNSDQEFLYNIDSDWQTVLQLINFWSSVLISFKLRCIE